MLTKEEIGYAILHIGSDVEVHIFPHKELAEVMEAAAAILPELEEQILEAFPNDDKRDNHSQEVVASILKKLTQAWKEAK